MDDIRTTLKSFTNWQIRHIRRVAKIAAHCIAKAAVKQVIDSVWMKEIYICIRDTILLKQSALFS